MGSSARVCAEKRKKLLFWLPLQYCYSDGAGGARKKNVKKKEEEMLTI